MDWYAWLAKTGLDPVLVYEYGLEFTRNELQAEDLPHFNHECLQSMGISVAKHRLEILKFARKDSSRLGKRLSGLMTAINKTKRSVGKYLGKLVTNEEAVSRNPGADGIREKHWKLALTRQYKSDKDFKEAKFLGKPRSLALSGPLTMARKSAKLSGPLAYGSNNPNLSGPLDVKSHDRAILALRSSKLSGPLEGAWAVTSSPKHSKPGDGRQVMTSNRMHLKLSGPLEMTANRSPRCSGPLEGFGHGMAIRSSPKHGANGYSDKDGMIDGFDEHSLWAKLFHDMKPT